MSEEKNKCAQVVESPNLVTALINAIREDFDINRQYYESHSYIWKDQLLKLITELNRNAALLNNAFPEKNPLVCAFNDISFLSGGLQYETEELPNGKFIVLPVHASFTEGQAAKHKDDLSVLDLLAIGSSKTLPKTAFPKKEPSKEQTTEEDKLYVRFLQPLEAVYSPIKTCSTNLGDRVRFTFLDAAHPDSFYLGVFEEGGGEKGEDVLCLETLLLRAKARRSSKKPSSERSCIIVEGAYAKQDGCEKQDKQFEKLWRGLLLHAEQEESGLLFSIELPKSTELYPERKKWKEFVENKIAHYLGGRTFRSKLKNSSFNARTESGYIPTEELEDRVKNALGTNKKKAHIASRKLLEQNAYDEIFSKDGSYVGRREGDFSALELTAKEVRKINSKLKQKVVLSDNEGKPAKKRGLRRFWPYALGAGLTLLAGGVAAYFGIIQHEEPKAPQEFPARTAAALDKQVLHITSEPFNDWRDFDKDDNGKTFSYPNYFSVKPDVKKYSVTDDFPAGWSLRKKSVEERVTDKKGISLFNGCDVKDGSLKCGENGFEISHIYCSDSKNVKKLPLDKISSLNVVLAKYDISGVQMIQSIVEIDMSDDLTCFDVRDAGLASMISKLVSMPENKIATTVPRRLDDIEEKAAKLLVNTLLRIGKSRGQQFSSYSTDIKIVLDFDQVIRSVKRYVASLDNHYSDADKYDTLYRIFSSNNQHKSILNHNYDLDAFLSISSEGKGYYISCSDINNVNLKMIKKEDQGEASVELLKSIRAACPEKERIDGQSLLNSLQKFFYDAAGLPRQNNPFIQYMPDKKFDEQELRSFFNERFNSTLLDWIGHYSVKFEGPRLYPDRFGEGSEEDILLRVRDEALLLVDQARAERKK